mmetsp:Transcript_19031/g.48038  ORF Transcript_19031/g.48038 Transcript_19031/m.48038 type:complete len:205 (-) Transcript_19031:118-732(-)
MLSEKSTKYSRWLLLLCSYARLRCFIDFFSACRAFSMLSSSPEISSPLSRLSSPICCDITFSCPICPRSPAISLSRSSCGAAMLICTASAPPGAPPPLNSGCRLLSPPRDGYPEPLAILHASGGRARHARPAHGMVPPRTEVLPGQRDRRPGVGCRRTVVGRAASRCQQAGRHAAASSGSFILISRTPHNCLTGEAQSHSGQPV